MFFPSIHKVFPDSSPPHQSFSRQVLAIHQVLTSYLLPPTVDYVIACNVRITLTVCSDNADIYTD